MRLEYYPEDKLKKELLEIISRYVDLGKHKVFVFGSRVTGRGSDRSDIDIGIAGEEKIGLSTLAQIKEAAEELPTLYSIDVVDFKDVSDKFRQVAMEKIEYLN